jgi:hypothetical protein
MLVADGDYTEWIFEVLPLKGGIASLYLTPYIVIDTPAGPRNYEHPPFVRSVTIRGNSFLAAGEFLSKYWDKLIGAIVSTGVIGLAVKWLLKKWTSSKQAPPWEHP